MTHARRPVRRLRGTTAVLLAVVLSAGVACSADQGSERADAEPAPAASRPTVLQPGRPGEPARTLPPGATVQQPRWNTADVRFLQRMIPHHAQALRMCELARTRAADPQVSALARRIAGAQGPEILAMSAWLQEHGLEVPSSQGMRHGQDDERGDAGHGGHGVHGHHPAPAPMPGMLTPAQMRRLAESSGPRFDRLFLAAMIGHHRGAVAMAGHALTAGNDLRVAEIAGDVSVEQKAEIDRMRAIRRRL